MITTNVQEDYKHIIKVSILDARKVFYPLNFVMARRDVFFDDDEALIILPLPDDIKFPATSKMTDGGMVLDYKIDISINNQLQVTEDQLRKFINKKVIVVFHFSAGKIIIGCNEQPLQYLFSDDNTTNPALSSGFSVECRGNAYFTKVIT